MPRPVINAVSGVLDYVAQPAAMLLAAPVLLHHLGLAQYGIWLIASAAVGAGTIVFSGFGDAVIQRIALLRSLEDPGAVHKVIATMLAINLVLGGLLASALWIIVPFVAGRITHSDPVLGLTCLWSLRIGAVLIVIKSVESVFISAQRAYERYAPAVRIGITSRLLMTGGAVVLALHGSGVVALMLVTAALSAAAAVAQWAALRDHLDSAPFRPAFDRETLRQLASVGGFTWLQAVSGVIFSQADRLIVGATAGASAVAYYGIVVQIAQPIHGLTAAGLHWLFPHLASRLGAGSIASLRRPIALTFLANLASAATLTAAVLILGPRAVALWMGPAFAAHEAVLLPTVAIGFSLLALNVTAHYTLMAAGNVRIITTLNVAGGLAMLLAMALLVPQHGAAGAASARLCYGPITLLLYLPLASRLRTPKQKLDAEYNPRRTRWEQA